MGAIKRWYEENFEKFTDEELIEMGYLEEDIEWLRIAFTNKIKKRGTGRINSVFSFCITCKTGIPTK